MQTTKGSARAGLAITMLAALGCGGATPTPVAPVDDDPGQPATAPAPAPEPTPPPTAAPTADNGGTELQLDLPGGGHVGGVAGSVNHQLVGLLAGDAALGDWIDLTGVAFATNSTNLLDPSLPVLDDVATILQAYPTAQVTLAVFADARGSEAYNLKMSEGRVATLAAYLVARGVADGRLETLAPGEYQARCTTSSDQACMAKNRRVALTIRAR